MSALGCAHQMQQPTFYPHYNPLNPYYPNPPVPLPTQMPPNVQAPLAPTRFTLQDFTLILEKFPQNPNKENYLQWRQVTLLQLHNHAVYPPITTRDKNNTIIFNRAMAEADSNQLYKATVKALKSHVSSYIDSSDHNASCSYSLWLRLDRKIMGERMSFTSATMEQVAGTTAVPPFLLRYCGMKYK
jgi:hypothetical protein